jgi:uncharacterized protein YecT (DUF1311 family)
VHVRTLQCLLWIIVAAATVPVVRASEERGLSKHYGACFLREDLSCADAELARQARMLEGLIAQLGRLTRTAAEREFIANDQARWLAARELFCEQHAWSHGKASREFHLADCRVGHTAIRVDALVDALDARQRSTVH